MVPLVPLNARINACRIVWREGDAARGKTAKKNRKRICFVIISSMAPRSQIQGVFRSL
jgi:hypothetical protein